MNIDYNGTAYKKLEPGELEMILSDDIAPKVISLLNLEIEVMQGNKYLLADGRTRYTLTVPVTKCEYVKKFILAIIATAENPLSNN